MLQQDGAGAPYHLVVLDQSGNGVLKNSDITAPNHAAVSKGIVYYYNVDLNHRMHGFLV